MERVGVTGEAAGSAGTVCVFLDFFVFVVCGRLIRGSGLIYGMAVFFQVFRAWAPSGFRYFNVSALFGMCFHRNFNRVVLVFRVLLKRVQRLRLKVLRIARRSATISLTSGIVSGILVVRAKGCHRKVKNVLTLRRRYRVINEDICQAKPP